MEETVVILPDIPPALGELSTIKWETLWHEPWRFADDQWVDNSVFFFELKARSCPQKRLQYKAWCRTLKLPPSWSLNTKSRLWSVRVPILTTAHERMRVLEFLGAVVWSSAPNFAQRWQQLPSTILHELGSSFWRSVLQHATKYPLSIQNKTLQMPSQIELRILGLAAMVVALQLCASELWGRLRFLFPPGLVQSAELHAGVLNLNLDEGDVAERVFDTWSVGTHSAGEFFASNF